MLPRYCIYTYYFREAGVPGSNDEGELNRWTGIMGPVFKHMHHYCWGLMKTNRALLIATDQQSKRFYLSNAIGEFDYVLIRSPADFVLLPEIHTKKGENLIRLGKNRDGVAELERAIAIKPDYWPPYAALSDYYKAKGDSAKARELLEQGLVVSPDAKGLKMRVEELEHTKEKNKH
jgi:tetratricopeptide (TPR) repeat protein